LRVLAGTLFVVYCFWQIYWLGQGKLPPALFRAATGLPAPTTGGTRSLIQLYHGNWRASLCWNPMAVPLTLLFVLSLLWLAGQLTRRQRLRLPDLLARAWVIVLALAWVLKVCGDRAYW
jgi:hypothetical protein